MRALRFGRRVVLPAVLIAAALALAAAGASTPAGASVSARAGAQAGTAAAGASGCHKVFQPPSSWVVVCSAGGGTGGGGGGGGGTGGGSGGGKFTCTLTKLSPDQITFEGLPPAPKGEQWDAIVCPGNAPFGGVTLVDTNTGAPAVTPEELLQVAESELTVPVLTPQTAPALNRKGLVGLPEWFWVPQASWRPVHVVVAAGPVWARLWATPETMSFDPGGGLSGASCNGPGTPYTATASGGCTFTYDQSSDTQQGGAYAAAVTVHWLVQWTGSDGTHQVLNNDLAVAFPFALRVAEGQALVTGSGQ
jgi:hypothetical protein